MVLRCKGNFRYNNYSLTCLPFEDYYLSLVVVVAQDVDHDAVHEALVLLQVDDHEFFEHVLVT